MEQEKLNLVNRKEIDKKSYEELLKMEEKLMNNKEATDLDLALVSATILDKELEMGIFKGYTMDEVFGDLLRGSKFEKNRNNNKQNCKYRTAAN